MSQKYLFSPNLTRSSRFLGFREPCRSSAGGRRRTGGVSRRVASGCPSEGGGGSGSVAGRGWRAWREWRRSRPGTARFAGCACGLQFSVSGGWRGGFPWAASRCPQQGGVGLPGGPRVGVRRKEAEASRRAASGCPSEGGGGFPAGCLRSIGTVVGGGKREGTLPVKGEFLLVKSDATPAPRGPFVVPWKFTS